MSRKYLVHIPRRLERMNLFSIDFFFEIQYFVIFQLPSYISACFDITIVRALKKDGY